MRVDEKPATVIGVTAPGVRLAGDNDLFLPLINPQSEARGQRDLGVLGRLAPGVGVGQASAEAAAVARQLGIEYPDTNKDLGAVVQNVSEYHIHPRIRQVLKAMLGGVGFVLLIACANAANLLLGRAMIRSREISIRASLGAGRADVIRQLLTESVLLSMTAGVLGSFFAYAGVKAFGAALGQMEEFGKPDWVVFSVDRNVLLYSLAISIGTGIVFGLAPALRMSRGELSSALREGGHGATEGVRRRWLSAMLVAGEVALSVVLLLGRWADGPQHGELGQSGFGGEHGQCSDHAGVVAGGQVQQAGGTAGVRSPVEDPTGIVAWRGFGGDGGPVAGKWGHAGTRQHVSD